MATLKELLAQQESLENQIAQARQRELGDAINKVRAIVAEYGLSQKDVFGDGRKPKKDTRTGRKVAPKYRDPATGAAWTGRGRTPNWLQGKDKSKFLIS